MTEIEEIINKNITELENIKTRNKNICITSNIQDYIFNIVTSSKFRRTKIDDSSRLDLINKIQKAVEQNLPIEFSIPFGSYKSFKLKKYINIYWAELFNIHYMTNYLIDIAYIYQPGVILSYSYQRDVMHEINNIAQEDINEYQDIFNKLINYYNNILPTNFKIRMQAINDLYANDNDWKKEFEEKLNNIKSDWISYSEDVKNKKITSAKNNFAIKGEKDFSNLTEKELEEKIIDSAMRVDCIESLSKRRPFNKSTNRIQLVFLKGPKPAVHVGVCEGSTSQFWVGIGVFDIRKNKSIPKILSSSQIKDIKELNINSKFSEISYKFNKVFYIINNM